MSTTTVTPETPKAPPLEKQTTVGNYFVSNYPPFSFWKPELLGELHAALERPPQPGNPDHRQYPGEHRQQHGQQQLLGVINQRHGDGLAVRDGRDGHQVPRV